MPVRLGRLVDAIASAIDHLERVGSTVRYDRPPGIDGGGPAVGVSDCQADWRTIHLACPWQHATMVSARVALVAAGCGDVGAPPVEPCVYVANHRGYLDIVLAGVLGATFLSRADVASWPFIGAVAKEIGAVFVERDELRGRRLVNARGSEWRSITLALASRQRSNRDG